MNTIKQDAHGLGLIPDSNPHIRAHLAISQIRLLPTRFDKSFPTVFNQNAYETPTEGINA